MAQLEENFDPEEVQILNRYCPGDCLDNMRRQVADEIFEELEKRLIPGTQLLHLTFTAEDWICLKARWLKGE